MYQQQQQPGMVNMGHPQIPPGATMRQGMPMQQVNMPPLQPGALAQQQAIQFQQAQHAQQQQARKKMMEEWDEPEGDELDNLSIRDVAVARYRRNHDYIAEVFSPYHINDIAPPESPYATKNIDELKKKIQLLQAEITDLHKDHDQKAQNYTASLHKLSRGIDKVVSVSSLEDTRNLQKGVVDDMGLTLLDEPLTTIVQLDYVEEDDMPLKIQATSSANHTVQQPAETTDQPITDTSAKLDQEGDAEEHTFDTLMDSDFINNNDSDMFEIGS